MLSRRALLVALAGAALPLPSRAQERITVVASFSILGDLVRAVGGGRIALSQLVGPDGDAHVYSPTPADAKTLAAARLIVVNGLGFEGWMTRLMRTSGARGRLVTVADAIVPLKARGGHDHGHSHAHGASDPHAWQDVRNAKAYVGAIRDGLIAADPDGRAVYEANATAYLAELDALHEAILAAVARIPHERRRAITAHDSFGYFERAYGIAFMSPQGVSTETEASARDVARIIRQVRSEKAAAVFLESIANPRLAEQLARETGARIGGRLYSDALSGPQGPAATYIAMMKHNISEIEKALAAGPA